MQGPTVNQIDMKRAFLILIISSLANSIKSQTLQPFWSKFEIADKQVPSQFTSLTVLEKSFAKFYGDFKNNRARLTLTDGINEISPRELKMPDFPIPCNCALKRDTVLITTALGLMSGLGVQIAMHKDSFQSTFFQSADGAKVFKKNEADSTYTDNITVNTLTQVLLLFKKPAFVHNELLYGEFNARFEPFYDLVHKPDPPLKRNYKAKFNFVCALQRQSQ